MSIEDSETSIILTVPHAMCLTKNDKKCDKTAKKQATSLYEFLLDNKESKVTDTPYYIHKTSEGLDLLITRTHRSNCDLNRPNCAERNPKFLKKLEEIVEAKRGKNYIILDIHSFPPGSIYDRNIDNQLVILYPRGRKLYALFMKEVLEEYKNYNIKLIPASKDNYIINKYPMGLIIEYPDV